MEGSELLTYCLDTFFTVMHLLLFPSQVNKAPRERTFFLHSKRTVVTSQKIICGAVQIF